MGTHHSSASGAHCAPSRPGFSLGELSQAQMALISSGFFSLLLSFALTRLSILYPTCVQSHYNFLFNFETCDCLGKKKVIFSIKLVNLEKCFVSAKHHHYSDLLSGTVLTSDLAENLEVCPNSPHL